METVRTPGLGARRAAQDSAAALVERLTTVVENQFRRPMRGAALRTCGELERLVMRNDVAAIERLFDEVRCRFDSDDAAELAELRRLADECRSWSQGASGEEGVGRALADLPGPGLVLNDVQLFARANIDHVVVSSAGVFAIETKVRGPHADLDRVTRQAARSMRRAATLAGMRLREAAKRCGIL